MKNWEAYNRGVDDVVAVIRENARELKEEYRRAFFKTTAKIAMDSCGDGMLKLCLQLERMKKLGEEE